MRITDVTPEFVEALYKKNGLKPTTCEMIVAGGRCCAIGAMIADAGKRLPGVARFRDARDLLVGIVDGDECEFRFFAFGFDDGFLGRADMFKASFDPAYEIGVKVGEHMSRVTL